MSVIKERPINVAVESSKYGFMVHIIDSPGSFTRDSDEVRALDKVVKEAGRYCKWVRCDCPTQPRVLVVERHFTGARIDDGDTEVLLAADREKVTSARFEEISRLAVYSAECFEQLFALVPNHDWVDKSKLRKTFYGDTPCTANQMLEHVNIVQAYYLSRIGLRMTIRPGYFLENRRECVHQLEDYFLKNALGKIHNMDNELWTVSKVLRRLIWHDLIHARALYRLGMRVVPEVIQRKDPFFFSWMGDGSSV